jgi:hypothetical protein
MAIDPAQIELTDQQKERLAAIAERAGRPYSELLDEWLSGIPIPEENGEPDPTKPRPKNLYEAFAAVGAIGCFSGPPDLSTNPKYMEGFGTNAKRSNAD